MVGRIMWLVLGRGFGNGFRHAPTIVADGLARGLAGCGLYCFHGESVVGELVCDGAESVRRPIWPDGASRTFRRAPIAANWDSICFGFIQVDLGTGARRAEHTVRLQRRSDSEDSFWFIAFAEQQLALVTEG